MNEDIYRANRSARNGIGGKMAVVPKFVATMLGDFNVFSSELARNLNAAITTQLNDKILDFGSGPYMNHTRMLRNLGYSVDAYDFGLNIRDGMVKILTPNKYGIVFASNVINVATSEYMLDSTLSLSKMTLKTGGIFIWNYPQSPRYMGLSEDKILAIVKSHFPNTIKKDKVFVSLKS